MWVFSEILHIVTAQFPLPLNIRSNSVAHEEALGDRGPCSIKGEAQGQSWTKEQAARIR